MNFINKSFILTEGTRIRGMLVPQRSNQSYILPNATKANFISVVKAKEPLGINPIMKPISVERKKIDNKVYERNRKMLLKIKDKTKERLLYKDIIKNPFGAILKINKSQSLKTLKPIKLNKMMHNKIRLDLTDKHINKHLRIEEEDNELKQRISSQNDKQKKGNDLYSKDDINGAKDNKCGNETKEVLCLNNELRVNNIEVKENDSKSKPNEIKDKDDQTKDEEQGKSEVLLNECEEEVNKEDINDILDYINNLDYDKYIRDLEIREAFQLIKNKMLKEKVEGDNQIENQEIDQGQVNEGSDKDNNKEEEGVQSPNTKACKEIPLEIINKTEEEKNKEIEKYLMLSKISKNIPKLRAVHSYKSIQKLLEREGVNDIKSIDPLKIAVIKEKPLAKDNEYASNRLPLLHSSPVL